MPMTDQQEDGEEAHRPVDHAGDAVAIAVSCRARNYG
jgi:hypothetical protein